MGYSMVRALEYAMLRAVGYCTVRAVELSTAFDHFRVSHSIPG